MTIKIDQLKPAKGLVYRPFFRATVTYPRHCKDERGCNVFIGFGITLPGAVAAATAHALHNIK